MMWSQSAALNRRRVRSELRKLRSASGQTVRETVNALSWPSSKLMHIEDGSVGVSTTDLVALLQHYGLTDRAEVDRLIASAQYGLRRTLAQTHGSALSPRFAEFLAYEEAARAIRQYEPQLIPGLLQTEDYARAVLRAYSGATCSAEIIEQRVAARRARHDLILQPDGPEALFVIDESALCRLASANHTNRLIMAQQLDELRRAAELPNVTVQIMPLRSGLYAAMKGSFVILEFEDAADGHLVYQEEPEGSVLYQGDIHRSVYFYDAFSDLEVNATAPDQFTAAVTGAVNAHRSTDQGTAS